MITKRINFIRPLKAIPQPTFWIGWKTIPTSGTHVSLPMPSDTIYWETEGPMPPGGYGHGLPDGMDGLTRTRCGDNTSRSDLRRKKQIKRVIIR